MAMDFKVDIQIKDRGYRKKDGGSVISIEKQKQDQTGEVTFESFLEDIRQYHIDAAIKVRELAINEWGLDPKARTFVDGSNNRLITDVRHFGKIEYVGSFSGTELLKEILAGLMLRAKVVTGRYEGSFQVRVNKQVVANDLMEFLNWVNGLANSKNKLVPGDEVIFVNVAPYARKLERLGVTKQRSPAPDKRRTVKSKDSEKRSGERILAPNGVFYLTYKRIVSKYKRASSIKFTFISGASLGGGLQDVRFKTFSRTSEKLGLKKPRAYLYPAIVVKIPSDGGLY